VTGRLEPLLLGREGVVRGRTDGVTLRLLSWPCGRGGSPEPGSDTLGHRCLDGTVVEQ